MTVDVSLKRATSKSTVYSSTCTQRHIFVWRVRHFLLAAFEGQFVQACISRISLRSTKVCMFSGERFLRGLAMHEVIVYDATLDLWQ